MTKRKACESINQIYGDIAPKEQVNSKESDNEDRCRTPHRIADMADHRALRCDARFRFAGFGFCGLGGVAIMRRITASRRRAASSSL